MIDRWNCPFHGLGYFLSHPRIWGWAFLGIFAAFISTIWVCYKVIAATYPHFVSFWGIVHSLGWASFALLLMILFVFPLIFNACFAKALANQLKREGISVSQESFWSSLLSSAGVFIRTLKWRILWPSLLLVAIFWAPVLIVPLTFLAANHLAIIESADLVLSLFGINADGRVEWIKKRGRDCLAAALSGALLSFLLSLILIGWILWIPALYCGVFLWIRSELKIK